jgi:hypothetical protein
MWGRGLRATFLLRFLAEVAVCTNLLQDLNHWHVVCAPGGALRLGDTRVSQGKSRNPRGKKPPSHIYAVSR